LCVNKRCVTDQWEEELQANGSEFVFELACESFDDEARALDNLGSWGGREGKIRCMENENFETRRLIDMESMWSFHVSLKMERAGYHSKVTRGHPPEVLGLGDEFFPHETSEGLKLLCTQFIAADDVLQSRVIESVYGEDCHPDRVLDSRSSGWGVVTNHKLHEDFVTIPDEKLAR